ncbi:MAG: hypothetical protein AAB515_02555 [Patescibacteria group bacterium]
MADSTAVVLSQTRGGTWASAIIFEFDLTKQEQSLIFECVQMYVKKFAQSLGFEFPAHIVSYDTLEDYILEDPIQESTPVDLSADSDWHEILALLEEQRPDLPYKLPHKPEEIQAMLANGRGLVQERRVKKRLEQGK